MCKKLKKLLKNKEITVYKLGKITGISDSTLRRYMYGSEPSFKNMCKIADAQIGRAHV